MTMKSVDLPHLRSVVLAGPRRSGKTTLAEHLLHTPGPSPGWAGARTARPPGLRARRAEAQRCRCPWRSRRSSHAQYRITLIDTPGYADFVGEMIEGFHAADARADRHGRLGRGPRRGRQRRRAGSLDGPAGLLRDQPLRPRERRPDRAPSTRCARVRQQDRAAPHGHRQGRVVPRATSTWSIEGLPGSRTASDARCPSRPTSSRGRAPPRPAARGRRRGRRRRPRRSTSKARRSPTQSWRRASTRASANRSSRRSS